MSSASSRCSDPLGCCWLKAAEVSGIAPEVWDPHACSAYVRVPNSSTALERQVLSRRAPPRGGKGAPDKPNVLYLVVDDLRPDLQAYGQNFTHNPNIAKLAARATVFDNAYCQISVCSPSRLSFMMGKSSHPLHLALRHSSLLTPHASRLTPRASLLTPRPRVDLFSFWSLLTLCCACKQSDLGVFNWCS